MQKKSKIQFAVGWLKTYNDYKTGEPVEYISGSASGKQQSVKLMIEDENGKVHKIDSFAVFFNEANENPKAPQVTFTASLEE